MFFIVCLSMVAVIVANPTPTDNEGGNYIANGKQIEINKDIPTEHYESIIKIMTYVMSLKQRYK